MTVTRAFVSHSKKAAPARKKQVRFIGSSFRKPAKHVHVQFQQGVKVNPARAHYLTKYIKDGSLLIAFKDLGAHPCESAPIRASHFLTKRRRVTSYDVFVATFCREKVDRPLIVASGLISWGLGLQLSKKIGIVGSAERDHAIYYEQTDRRKRATALRTVRLCRNEEATRKYSRRALARFISASPHLTNKLRKPLN